MFAFDIISEHSIERRPVKVVCSNCDCDDDFFDIDMEIEDE